METSPDPIRNEVEAIKASWKADPCWDLHEFDAAAADLPHLIPFQAELRQFALDTRAAWAAEVKAAHDAKIGAIARRILERNNEEDTVTRGMLAPPGVVRLIRVHEMLHLLEPMHSDRFIALLDEHYPTWREARAELNALPLGAEEWAE